MGRAWVHETQLTATNRSPSEHNAVALIASGAQKCEKGKSLLFAAISTAISMKAPAPLTELLTWLIAIPQEESNPPVVPIFLQTAAKVIFH